MRKLVLTCLVLTFALGAAPAAAEEAPLPVPAADQAAATLLPAATAAPRCGAAPAPAVQNAAPEWLEMSCCISRCRRDSDCTAFCGGPGQCIMVNSCCRECACYQI